MIQKHELPILEYDSNSEEVIKPNHGAEQLKLPEKCVYAFLGEAVDDYASLANVLKHDERDWGKNSLRKALELCIAVLQRI